MMGDQVTESHEEGWPGAGVFFNFSIKIVYTGILFILFCRVNWLDVEELNIDVRG